jgi:hypothetical protein
MKDDLLKRARAGLFGRGRTRSVFLRRAVSDAYYAVFHALAALCADNLVGASKRSSEAWRRIYRGIDHVRAREEFRRADVRKMHRGVERIAPAFIELQDARHQADYDPLNRLSRRADAEAFIGVAEIALADIDALPPDVGIELAACLLLKRRP